MGALSVFGRISLSILCIRVNHQLFQVQVGLQKVGVKLETVRVLTNLYRSSAFSHQPIAAAVCYFETAPGPLAEKNLNKNLQNGDCKISPRCHGLTRNGDVAANTAIVALTTTRTNAPPAITGTPLAPELVPSAAADPLAGEGVDVPTTGVPTEPEVGGIVSVVDDGVRSTAPSEDTGVGAVVAEGSISAVKEPLLESLSPGKRKVRSNGRKFI